MDKENVVLSIMEYYPAIKSSENLPFATTWMELEYIMLSEISQTEKDKYCMVSLICGILKKVKVIEIERRKVVDKGWDVWVGKIVRGCLKGTNCQL